MVRGVKTRAIAATARPPPKSERLRPRAPDAVGVPNGRAKRRPPQRPARSPPKAVARSTPLRSPPKGAARSTPPRSAPKTARNDGQYQRRALQPAHHLGWHRAAVDVEVAEEDAAHAEHRAGSTQRWDVRIPGDRRDRATERRDQIGDQKAPAADQPLDDKAGVPQHGHVQHELERAEIQKRAHQETRGIASRRERPVVGAPSDEIGRRGAPGIDAPDRHRHERQRVQADQQRRRPGVRSLRGQGRDEFGAGPIRERRLPGANAVLGRKLVVPVTHRRFCLPH